MKRSKCGWKLFSTTLLVLAIGGILCAPVFADYEMGINDQGSSYDKYPVLKTGEEINTIINSLSGVVPNEYGTIDNEIIEEIVFTEEAAPAGGTTAELAESDGSVKAWFDRGKATIFIGTQAERINLNENSANMFNGLKAMKRVDLQKFDTSSVIDMGSIFSQCSSLRELDVSRFDTSAVTDMRFMFFQCSSLKELDVSGFDTSSVKDMDGMFDGCGSLSELDVRNFDTSSVTDMSGMFVGCSSLGELNLSNFDTSSVTGMSAMFYGCSSLKELDVSSFDTSSVGNMAYMFYGCGSLRGVDVKDWDVSSVTNFRHTFADCFCLREIDVSRWDTRSAITLDGIFNDCRRLKVIDISSWDTASCREFDQMFDNCTALRRIRGLSQINTGNGISFEEMFFGCRKLRRLNLNSVNTDHVDGSEFTAYASSIESKSTIKNMLVGCNGLKEITISPSLLQSICQTGENVLLDKLNEVGYIVVSPKTGSMTPMLRPDRDQAAFYAQDTFKRGDIALFKSGRSQNLVMHRIYRALSNGYLIKGDRDRYVEFVPKENVYAVARQIYRNGKSIPGNSIRYYALSVFSKAYNSLLASYRGSNHVFWKAARRAKRKLF